MPDKTASNSSSNETPVNISNSDADSKQRKTKPKSSNVEADSTEVSPASTELVFTTREAWLYHELYDTVIATDCRPQLVLALYRYCSQLVASNPSLVQIYDNDSVMNFTDISKILAHSENLHDFDTKIVISSLVSLELASFPDLLTALCSRKSRLGSRTLELSVLEVLLSTDGLHQQPIIDAELVFDDTPIIQAARSHAYDVIWLLLRHGAHVTRGWMEFENPLEMLLFSPTERYMADVDMDAIERCIALVLTAMRSVDVQHLEKLQKLSYYSLHKDWRRALTNGIQVAWDSSSNLPSLMHLCRCTIRESITPRHHMSKAISQLPIPKALKCYVSLENASPTNACCDQ